THAAPIGHCTSQPPQCAGSSSSRSHRSPQIVPPSGQTQAPPSQLAPGAQATPQPPQCAGPSSPTHSPPQARGAPGHAQAPSTHALPDRQSTPQPPQLAGSLVTSTQPPSQAAVPAGQLSLPLHPSQRHPRSSAQMARDETTSTIGRA